MHKTKCDLCVWLEHLSRPAQRFCWPYLGYLICVVAAMDLEKRERLEREKRGIVKIYVVTHTLCGMDTDGLATMYTMYPRLECTSKSLAKYIHKQLDNPEGRWQLFVEFDGRLVDHRIKDATKVYYLRMNMYEESAWECRTPRTISISSINGGYCKDEHGESEDDTEGSQFFDFLLSLRT